MASSVIANAQDSNPQRESQSTIANRRAVLARLALTGTLDPTRVEDTGPDLEVVRRNEAREDLISLAGELQALYDLGAQTERDANFVQQVDDGAQESAETVRQILEFINRGADPPANEAVELGNETFDERVLRLALLYLSILEPVAGLIDGGTLDLEQLDQARSGLGEIEALTLSLPDLVR